MNISSLVPNTPSGFLLLASITLAALGFVFLCGWLLVPARSLGMGKLLLLAVRLASGMVFCTGLSALFCLRHLNYMTWLSIGQMALAGWLHWKSRQTMEASPDGHDHWNWKELAGISALCLILLPVYQVPYLYNDADGRVLQLHSDLGYFVDTVVALPESQAANGWAIFMGKESEAACGVRDAWYHWGALMLAVGIRFVTGLPAAPVTLIVVNALLNILLIVTAGALARGVTKLSPVQACMAGALAITCVHWLRLPQVIELLAYWLPYDVFHHARVPLALIFPYKFEGILMLASLALWQWGHGKGALGMLFMAACSAPHTVAAGGAAAATLAGLGLVMRDSRMLRTGAGATLALLGGWALVHFGFRSSLPAPKSESIVSFIGAGHLWEIFRFGLIDSLVTMMFSALLLAGAVFLILQGKREDRPDKRLLGWLCFCSVVGSAFALQGLRSADRFHVVVMSHAVLIMPVCACGLVSMLSQLQGRARLGSLAVLSAVAVMGAHTLLTPAITRQKETWSLSDLTELRQHVKGQPVGYFSRFDRDWWIPKHALFGGLLDSRIIRLNPLDERKSSHYSEAAYKIPFEWLPPLKDEPSNAWSLRLAQKLGIQYVVETWEDRLPKKLREQCQPVWSGPGLMLYALPKAESATKGKVAWVSEQGK